MSETCATCRYFRALSEKGGQCRRYAPVASVELRFPPVEASDWCGEYAPRLAFNAAAFALASRGMGEPT